MHIYVLYLHTAGHSPRIPYARGSWTPQNCTEGLHQQMLQDQEVQDGNGSSELSQEDWEFLLRLQVVQHLFYQAWSWNPITGMFFGLLLKTQVLAGWVGRKIAQVSDSVCLRDDRLGQGKAVGRTIWPRGCCRDCKEASMQRAQHLQQGYTTPSVGPKPAHPAY